MNIKVCFVEDLPQVIDGGNSLNNWSWKEVRRKMQTLYTCKLCGLLSPFNCAGRCPECHNGLLDGFSNASGPCVVRGCNAERVSARYLSDGNTYVYECRKHSGRGRRFDHSKY